MKYNVTRKAIIVGAPGGGRTKRLTGVKPDILAYPSFLRSSRGGRWYDREIIVLEDPTATELLTVTQTAYADYLHIYFSGHGYTDAGSGCRMLCCKDGDVADIALLQGRSPRMFLTTDVCRDFLGEGIGSIPLPGPDYFDFTGEPSVARQLFDQAILASPAGKTILHGTQTGFKAADSKDGGVFSQALLQVGSHMVIEEGYQLVTIEQVLYHVPDVLQKKGNSQVPDLIRISGNLSVPFAVAMPAQREVEPILPYSSHAVHSDSESNGLLWILGVLMFAAVVMKQ